MDKRKLFILVLAIFISIAVLTVGYKVKSIQQLDNEKEIKEVVKAALNIYSKSVYPPEYTKSPKINIPSQVIEKKINEITEECEKYYSAKSGILANKMKNYQTAVLGDAYPSSDMRVSELKINEIKFLEVKIEGDSATVIADVYGEGKMVALIPVEDTGNKNEAINVSEMTPEYQKKLYEQTQKLPKKLVTYHNKSGARYYFNLSKENGTWKITSENFSFLPGYEP